MSNATPNRQQRRAAQALARRAEQTEFRSQKLDPKTRTKARKAFEIIKKTDHARLGTRANLYSKCVAGVTVFEALRERGVPNSNEPFYYESLLGQQSAHLFGDATLDNVLTVLIEETTDHKWAWDVIVDNGLIFGSREMTPCASREEAEERALTGLGMIGRVGKPGSDYVAEAKPERKLQIRVNRSTYVVRNLTDDTHFYDKLAGAIVIEGTTFDGLMARFADMVLTDGAERHPVALAMLVNCGWTHLTQQILEDFCSANGVSLAVSPEAIKTAESPLNAMH